jgi:hypothetical protein
MFAPVVWLFLCEEEKILGLIVSVEVLVFFVPQFQISREFA